MSFLLGICPRCGKTGDFEAKTCTFCNHALSDKSFSLEDLLLPEKNEMQKFQMELQRTGKYYNKELWDKRAAAEEKEREQTTKEKQEWEERANTLYIKICPTCGALFKGADMNCTVCHQQLAAINITGSEWDALSNEKKRKKHLDLLEAFCYTSALFDRDKWIARVIRQKNPFGESIEFADYKSLTNVLCPHCQSSQVQIVNARGFLMLKKKYCLNCKSYF